MTNTPNYSDIIQAFGIEHQCRQAMEECGELIQAINKCVRYPNDPVTRLSLIEEIADVKIMILQLEQMFGITWKEADRMFQFKKNRLLEKYRKKTGVVGGCSVARRFEEVQKGSASFRNGKG